jgi:LmbE family N-acetylglucosaminyl deacetylase
MKNPYLDWLQEHDRHQLLGAALPLGGFDAPARPALDGSAPSVMIFAPHPDDECVIGGLALRIMRERGARVINVAVTLGSRKDRQTARRNELAAACAYLGFELVHTGEHGLEDVHPAARASDPRAWAAKVMCVRDILLAHRPGIIIMPHDCRLESHAPRHACPGARRIALDRVRWLPWRRHRDGILGRDDHRPTSCSRWARPTSPTSSPRCRSTRAR